MKNIIANFIGNPRFCDATQAFGYASSESDYENILERNDVKEFILKMDSTSLINFAKERNSRTLWHYVLRTTVIPVAKALEISKEIGNFSVVLRSDISSEEIIALLKGGDYPINALTIDYVTQKEDITEDHLIDLISVNPSVSVALMVLRTEKITPEKSIEIASKLNNSDLSKIVFSRESVTNFLKNMIPEKAISYAKQINNWRVWALVLSNKNMPIEYSLKHANSIGNIQIFRSIVSEKEELTPEQIFTISGKYNDDAIWDSALTRKDFVEYLQTSSDDYDKILSVVISSGQEELTNIFVGREYLPISDFCKIHDAYNDDVIVYKYIHGKKRDMSELIKLSKLINVFTLNEYIVNYSELSPREILTFANSFDNYNLWNLAMKRGDINEFILNEDLSALISYARSQNDDALIEEIIQMRHDFKAPEIIRLVAEIKNLDLWNSVISTGKVLSYLISTDLEVLLKEFSSVDYVPIYRVLFKRVEFAPQRILEYAHRFKDENVMDIALSNPIVIEYLTA